MLQWRRRLRGPWRGRLRLGRPDRIDQCQSQALRGRGVGPARRLDPRRDAAQQNQLHEQCERDDDGRWQLAANRARPLGFVAHHRRSWVAIPICMMPLWRQASITRMSSCKGVGSLKLWEFSTNPDRGCGNFAKTRRAKPTGEVIGRENES